MIRGKRLMPLELAQMRQDFCWAHKVFDLPVAALYFGDLS